MLRNILLIVLTNLVLFVSQATAQEKVIVHGAERFQALEFDNSDLASQVVNEAIEFSLGQYGTVEITLIPATVMASDHSINGRVTTSINQNIQTFKGYSADGGAVRLTTADRFTYGYIEYQDETYWIEPIWYYSESKTKNNGIVVYKQSDVRNSNEHACGVTETSKRVKSLEEESSQARSVGDCYEVELAIASDFSMYEKYNNSIADVTAHNVAIINNVNGNYTGEFDDNIEFIIVTQYISNCSTCDPWTSSTNSSALLNSFTSWAFNGGFGVVHDVGELWSNRNFDGVTVGLAWVDEICDELPYHVLQDYTMNANELRVLTAHEIAHNFGALHDGNPSPFIMAPYVQNTTIWSTASKNVISANIANGASPCLGSCPTGSPPVAAFSANTTSICAGSNVAFTDLSLNAPTSWSWVFEGGTPTTSNVQNPTVTYQIAGNHKVTLTVTNNFGSNTLVRNNYIEVQEVPDAEFSFEVDNKVVSFQEEVVSPVTAFWDFGDGNTSNQLNPVHAYGQNGTYEVTLTSSMTCGSNSISMLIDIGPCIDNIFLTGSLQEAAHVVGANIFCEGQIQANQELHLHAPNSILLMEGFDMPFGAVLNVTNNGCVD